MTKVNHMPVAPPLPGGSIDFNKLHTAAVANADPASALETALIAPPKAKARATTVTTLSASVGAPSISAPTVAVKKEDSTNG